MARRTKKAETPTTPPPEAPLGRLLARGAGALSDAELLALLLDSNDEGETLGAAARLLKEHHGLSSLLRGGPGALRRQVSAQAAARLLAALEIAMRLAREEIPKRVPLRRPREVVRYLYLRYGGIRREVVGALFLDHRNRLLEAGEFFRGTASEAVAEPVPILRAAILAGAAGIVLFHTHPGGDPAPSERDLDFTRRMRRAAEAVGISMQDHLVIAGLERWYSFYCASQHSLDG